MENEVIKFEYENKDIRTLKNENGETLFIAKDVCNILGLGNVTRAVSRLDDDEKLTLLLVMSGQQRETWVTNESGLYHLILTSEKPEAKAFRKWVTGTVLPAIRKAGIHNPAELVNKESELQRVNKIIEDLKNAINSKKSEIKDLKNALSENEHLFREIAMSNPNQLKLNFEEEAK